ncbi:alpha/beta fold hydrolase [Sciscionella sediminilitoris]|uniref:alpha/beta fold hydrolase n=1 Tax=Sciscionella sediminilitoris TaxID=1445613 RepID=UPI000565198C|nr:alpha/beta hydrolase [Sciscionella sp. SE31]
MTTFVLVPGSDGRSSYWQRFVPELESRGHEALPVELPLGADAGLADYAEAIVATAQGHGEVVLLAQSMGAFSAPLACERLPVRELVLLNPMVPAPGERAADWWAATGQPAALAEYARRGGWHTEFDMRIHLFHDVPEEITAAALAEGGGAALDTVFSEPWPLTGWPRVPIRVLQGRADRFFPLTFQRRVVAERLGGIGIEELPGGHLLAFGYPRELAEALTASASGPRRSASA